MRRVIACALWLLLAACGANAALPFLHDDYASALREAKQRKLPIFVEVSAPW